MGNRVITHKNKIPLVSGLPPNNILATIPDSAMIGGELLSGTITAYFSASLQTVTASNVGIKIPITNNTIYNISSALNNDFTVWDRSVVGNSPNFFSGTGIPGGLYHPITNPNGFYRGYWTLTGDSDYIYLYTNTATQKNNMTVGTEYWFAFKVYYDESLGVGDLDYTIESIAGGNRYTATGDNINFLRGPSAPQTFNKFMIVSVLDYNS